jgi:hypothetical protein
VVAVPISNSGLMFRCNMCVIPSAIEALVTPLLGVTFEIKDFRIAILTGRRFLHLGDLSGVVEVVFTMSASKDP